MVERQSAGLASERGRKGEMFKRTHYIALILAVLGVAVIFKLPARTVGRLKLAISGLYLPFFGLTGSAHELADKTGNALLSKQELLRRNQQLRRENQQLRFQLQQLEEAWRENGRLRQQLAWPKPAHWNFRLARVIGRDPANWWRSIQIDAGARDGLRPNLPVLTSDGLTGNLVGRIQTLGETRSQVILLGDPNLRVAAQVLPTAETGVIFPDATGPSENNMVQLGFLPGNSSVRPGQMVVTWGEGGVFPAGLPIGKIVDTRSKDFGVSTEARVQLLANLSSLEEVWVKLP